MNRKELQEELKRNESLLKTCQEHINVLHSQIETHQQRIKEVKDELELNWIWIDEGSATGIRIGLKSDGLLLMGPDDVLLELRDELIEQGKLK